MRRLLPEPADDITIEEAYAGPLGSRTDRPWVGLCMVASIDGSTVVGGRSAGLSSPTDSAVLSQLRRVADVIVVGAGTVRQEGYGPPRKAGQRVGVISRSADLDLTTDLFTSGAGFLITTDDNDVDTGGIDVIRAGTGSVDLTAALRGLPRLIDNCRVIQAEGGAALNGALVDADLLDELDVTTSPAAVGGSGPRLATDAGHHAHHFELVQLGIDEQSFLYARWLRRRR